MTTKEKLEEMLTESGNDYISGNAIAERLGITRAAVWKNILQLREEGYDIEAVTNRGYRLSDTNDVVSTESIRKYLGDEAGSYPLEVLKETVSTNSLMKERAESLPEWFTLIAGSQSGGRGRSGRSFYSPPGTGVYISIIQRPSIPADQATRITTAAAVAACRAIEECSDSKAVIKWVNDVFVNGKKVCGILTEASFNMESGTLDWAVMGIGFNVYEPEGGFPGEIARTAGPIVKEKQKDLRSRIAASFMKHFRLVCANLNKPDFYEEYRNRSFIIGRRINVLKGSETQPATAIEIDDECRLIVRYDNGREETLSSGEVSIRPVQ